MCWGGGGDGRAEGPGVDGCAAGGVIGGDFGLVTSVSWEKESSNGSENVVVVDNDPDSKGKLWRDRDSILGCKFIVSDGEPTTD